MIQTYPGTRAVTLESINLTDGFWKDKVDLIREVSVWNVYKRFSETGRFEAFRFTWKEGMENRPHIFWDSDVAKWIEGVAYLLMKERNAEMEAIVDDVVENIEKNRMQDGYFNSYFGHLEPENRFTRRGAHELYCFGHLLEAAIAYRDATGKDKFFLLMKDYADLIYKIFFEEKSAAFQTPGHEEIELALVKLYRVTGEKKYLDLAMYFIDRRGNNSTDTYGTTGATEWQDHLPVRAQTTAEGHAVRACYLYCAVADLALETGDEMLLAAAKTLYNNITRRRMYVTGAIGQTCVAETFMDDFDLPNQTAYAETCANLSLALFARRMSVLDPDSRYADIVERVLYNSFLSGMSLDGKSFFYSNMQENDLAVRRRRYNTRHTIFRPDDTRVEVFDCSCCPPNVVRTVASIADFQYTADAETVWCHQYFASDAHIGEKHLSLKTAYPYSGEITIVYGGKAGTLALRIPGWCRDYTLTVNRKKTDAEIRAGYAYVPVSDGDTVSLSLQMPVRFIEAHPRVWETAGRVSVMRGPLVYCMEAVDHDLPLRDIRLRESAAYETVTDDTLGVPVLLTEGCVRVWNDDLLYDVPAETKPCRVRLIPYFAFANRGSTDMLIWTMKA